MHVFKTIAFGSLLPYIFIYYNKFACLIKQTSTKYNFKSLEPSQIVANLIKVKNVFF